MDMDMKVCKDKKCCCKCCGGALMVAGIIFGLMALVHLYRFFYFFPIVFGTVVLGPNASIVGFIVLGLLSIWMFCSHRKLCRSCSVCCHKDDVVVRTPRDPEVR